MWGNCYWADVSSGLYIGRALMIHALYTCTYLKHCMCHVFPIASSIWTPSAGNTLWHLWQRSETEKLMRIWEMEMIIRTQRYCTRMITQGTQHKFLFVIEGMCQNLMVKYIKWRKGSVCTSLTFTVFSVITTISISRGSVFRNWLVSITVIKDSITVLWKNISTQRHTPAQVSTDMTFLEIAYTLISISESCNSTHILFLFTTCFCFRYHLQIVHQSSLWVCTLLPEAWYPWAWLWASLPPTPPWPHSTVLDSCLAPSHLLPRAPHPLALIQNVIELQLGSQYTQLHTFFLKFISLFRFNLDAFM